jgi:hypothetical protein
VVAALLDPPLQLLYRGLAEIEADGRRLRDRVRLDREDATLLPEHPLDNRLLAREVEAADVQDDRRPPTLARHGAHHDLIVPEPATRQALRRAPCRISIANCSEIGVAAATPCTRSSRPPSPSGSTEV